MQEFLRWQMAVAGERIMSLIGRNRWDINALQEEANSWIWDCHASELATSVDAAGGEISRMVDGLFRLFRLFELERIFDQGAKRLMIMK